MSVLSLFIMVTVIVRILTGCVNFALISAICYFTVFNVLRFVL